MSIKSIEGSRSPIPVISSADSSSSSSSSKSYVREIDEHVQRIVMSEPAYVLFTNELDQAKTQRAFQLLPPHGNAILGAGLFMPLNVAAWQPGIKYIHAFDVDPRFESTWQLIQNLLLDSDCDYTSIKRFFFKACPDPEVSARFKKELDDGTSWLCSPTYFERVREVFLSKHFTFTQLDIGNTAQFGEFLKSREGTPRVIYISNITETGTGAIFLEKFPQRYKEYHESLLNIPVDLPVIDAESEDNEDCAQQRLHTDVRGYLLPKTSLGMWDYKRALEEDNYEKVRFYLMNGLIPTSEKGSTDL